MDIRGEGRVSNRATEFLMFLIFWHFTEGQNRVGLLRPDRRSKGLPQPIQTAVSIFTFMA